MNNDMFKNKEFMAEDTEQKIIDYVLENVPVHFNPGETQDIVHEQDKIFLSCGYENGMRHGPFKFISSDHVTVKGTFRKDALNGWLQYNNGKTSKSFFVWNNRFYNDKERIFDDLLSAGEKVPAKNKIMLGLLAGALVLGMWHGNTRETNNRFDTVKQVKVCKFAPVQHTMQNQKNR